jgi:hypothetical protein
VFPLFDGVRSIPSTPGARKAVYPVEDVSVLVRRVLTGLDQQGLAALCAPLPGGDEPDDDPDLAPVLRLCGPRLLLANGVAILPPSRRFNCERLDRVYRVFAAQRHVNGVNGYALAPSDYRPGLAVWAYSDGGVLQEGEFGPAAGWLAEMLAPLDHPRLDVADPGASPAALAAAASELWESIEGDLPRAQPRPDWTLPGEGRDAEPGSGWHGDIVSGLPEGRWTLSSHGIEICEETYAGGRRHGPSTWWHLKEDLPADFEPDLCEDEDPFVYGQGAVERTGSFAHGAALGRFGFFDEQGRLLQEGDYRDGWPHGQWTVYPEASTGLAEPAHVQYAAGVPATWTIPPLAIDAVTVLHPTRGRTTLAELASGSHGLIMVDCRESAVHELPPKAADELAALPDIAVVGVHPSSPATGLLGRRPIEVVADPTGGLARAYYANARMPLTFLGPDGRYQGGTQLRYARFTGRFAAADG